MMVVQGVAELRLDTRVALCIWDKIGGSFRKVVAVRRDTFTILKCWSAEYGYKRTLNMLLRVNACELWHSIHSPDERMQLALTLLIYSRICDPTFHKVLRRSRSKGAIILADVPGVSHSVSYCLSTYSKLATPMHALLPSRQPWCPGPC